MCPERRRRPTGFALPALIFLIVIVGLIAVGMVQLLGTSQQSVSQEITSLRAYLAAQSGLQWGMYETVYPPAAGRAPPRSRSASPRRDWMERGRR